MLTNMLVAILLILIIQLLFSDLIIKLTKNLLEQMKILKSMFKDFSVAILLVCFYIACLITPYMIILTLLIETIK